MTNPVSLPVSAAVGARSGEADLWCTYAAVRTLSWLGKDDEITDPGGTAAYLCARRNADGGYAWARGMTSDAWATFYCTQALSDLRSCPPGLGKTTEWLRRTWSGEAFGMTPGQRPDVWATHFSVRTLIEVCEEDVPDRDRLRQWLSSLQTDEGGLSWTPEHAAAGRPDVRASYYGIAAWAAMSRVDAIAPPWSVGRLADWIRGQRDASGGFRFSSNASEPCLWATYRATGALQLLGAVADGECRQWVLDRRGPNGAFTRWRGYEVEDVWASFCAVGALRATGGVAEGIADVVTARMAAVACPGGGYTYREPVVAADALSTAATVLMAGPDDPLAGSRISWLEACQMPNEGGVMYMPGRGAEVRCTLWAVAAGAFAGNEPAKGAVLEWLKDLQNPDGGFGYWEGRGSDLVSTAAAVEIVRLLERPIESVVDADALAAFVDRQRGLDGSGSLRAGLQVLRILHALGLRESTHLRGLLDRHRVRGGGYANEGSRMPDLLSTYDAVITSSRLGVGIDREHVRRFLDSVRRPEGTAWTPLAPSGGGLLADCLGTLLGGWLGGAVGEPAALALS